MKKRIKLKGRIKTYIQFCIYLGILLAAVDVAMFMIDFHAGLLLAGFTVFYFDPDQRIGKLCHRVRTDTEKASQGDGSAVRAAG